MIRHLTLTLAFISLSACDLDQVVNEKIIKATVVESKNNQNDFWVVLQDERGKRWIKEIGGGQCGFGPVNLTKGKVIDARLFTLRKGDRLREDIDAGDLERRFC